MVFFCMRLLVSTQLYEHFKNEDRIGGMDTINYYALDNCMTCIHVYACEGHAASQEEAGEGKKDFIRTDDESELLLNVVDN